MQRLRVLTAVLLLTAIASAAPEEDGAEPATSSTTAVTAPELTPKTFAALRDRIRPTEEESTWRAVGWRPTFWEGVVDGHAQRRPVLLWAMNGHPLGQT